MSKPAPINRSSLADAPSAAAQRLRADRLSAYFTRHDDRLRVKPALRPMVRLARHKLLQDPPLTKLARACCRNTRVGLPRATGIATLVVDATLGLLCVLSALRLLRFTPEATLLFKLQPDDIGLNIADFSCFGLVDACHSNIARRAGAVNLEPA